MSDHIKQFFILTDLFSNDSPTKYGIMFHGWENFDNQVIS